MKYRVVRRQSLQRARLHLGDKRLPFREDRVIDSIESLMFEAAPIESIPPVSNAFATTFEFDLARAIEVLPLTWVEPRTATYLAARLAYFTEIASLGIDVSELALSPSRNHDRGNHRPPR